MMVIETGRPGELEDGFDGLFRREFAPICRTAYLIVGDWEVAREITQDAFVKALRHWRRVSGLDRPGAWVRRVAIRDAVRARRKESRQRTAIPADASTDLDHDMVDVQRALLELPGRQRAAVVLHYLDDRPVAEVAALLGCSEGTVKTHLARARIALGARLGEEVTDDAR